MRVLVADDHSLFRDGLISLLEAAGFDVVGQVGDGQTAIEVALRLRPDLVLMDVNMPRMGGLVALQRIREALPETQVVMLTVSEDDADLFRAIKSGARGYLLKNLTANEFLRTLEGLGRGEAAITRKTATRLVEGLASSPPRPRPAASLTHQEIEILQLVVAGLSNKEIARRLSISGNTVKYHLKSIFRKLGVLTRTEAAIHALQAELVKPVSRD